MNYDPWKDERAGRCWSLARYPRLSSSNKFAGVLEFSQCLPLYLFFSIDQPMTNCMGSLVSYFRPRLSLDGQDEV